MPFPVEEKFIKLAEQKLSVAFPASFRFKMMKENGGQVETPPNAWELYPFLDSSDRKQLTCLPRSSPRPTGGRSSRLSVGR